MTILLLFLTGAGLALWIALRKPGTSERYAWWPRCWEWGVQALGVMLMSVAAVRVIAVLMAVT